MSAENSSARLSTTHLILVPALITLGITIIRLVGELEHWPAPWFSNSAGGGGAIIGISWLPIIFGPYFALKLSDAGERTCGLGKAIGMTVLALIVMAGGLFLSFKSGLGNFNVLLLVGFALVLVAALIPLAGWNELTKVLLAYGYAARIPVLIVMFFAMRASWGTHYDAVPPGFPPDVAFGAKFVLLAVLPQMIFWVAYTVIVGSLLGIGVAAIFRRGKPVAQATA